MRRRHSLLPAIPLLFVAFGLASVARAQTTILIDGVNDFLPQHAVAGADASTWYFTSDATHFYFGLAHTDLGSASSARFLTLQVDTDPQPDPLTGAGTTMGVAYNTQQPELPFRGDVHLRWRLDAATMSALFWDGSQWSAMAADFVAAGSFGTQYVELAISRADLGAPSSISVIGSIVDETSFAESTYAFVPSTTPGGYDPDPVDFLDLNLFAPPPVPSLSLPGAALAVLLCAALSRTTSPQRTPRRPPHLPPNARPTSSSDAKRTPDCRFA
ncbi:MAG: hypothetical protein KDA28_12295, partial [Phycisphaerales bacterium]|nr:hypothetical protein [Phycisphaerales bacterium]